MNIPHEMLAYATPARMPIGTPGKTGYLRLGFELDADSRSVMRHWERRAPLIVQQELYFDREWPELPCVYILSSGGPNVEGDRYRQHISVAQNAYAHIATGAATKLASMQNNYSSLAQHITLDAGAYLEYLPEPVIPCRNTRYISDTEIVIDSTATLFYAESYLCGRKYHGEDFDYDILSLHTRASRHDGEELFCEKMIIEPKQRGVREIGAMADYDIFATALILTPPEIANRIYALINPYIDRMTHTALGITRLPNDCGLICRVMGRESGDVKRILRQLCSTVREQVKHRPMPDEFPWR